MGHAVTIGSGVLGFDTDSVVSAAYALCMADAGNGYCGRYISLTSPEITGDLSASEVAILTENGLAILVVQHPRGGSNGASQGTTDAENAIANLNSLIAPSGLVVYCDIEGFTPGFAVAYANAWGTKINASNKYKAGFYGPEDILSSTTVTWHGLWENVTCFGGALTGANISQGPEACNGGGEVHTCGTAGQLLIDTDRTLTSIGGFWGL